MKLLILALGFVGTATFAHAEETAAEKGTSTVNSMKRGAKKVGHRMEEAAVCAQGDLKCAALKAKNRVKEGADAAGDKVNEKTK